MNKKIVFGLLIIIMIFMVSGCSDKNIAKETKKQNKTYECRYSKDDNKDEKRFLTKYIVELNDKDELEVYTVLSGFSNYKSETDGYKEFCDGLKSKMQKDLLEKYKDAISMEVVCDKKNNYEVYALKKYNVKKIKDIEEFSSVYNSIKTHIKENGKFDLDSWKNYFDTDSLKKGNYTCNF